VFASADRRARSKISGIDAYRRFPHALARRDEDRRARIKGIDRIFELSRQQAIATFSDGQRQRNDHRIHFGTGNRPSPRLKLITKEEPLRFCFWTLVQEFPVISGKGKNCSTRLRIKAVARGGLARAASAATANSNRLRFSALGQKSATRASNVPVYIDFAPTKKSAKLHRALISSFSTIDCSVVLFADEKKRRRK